MPHFKDTPLGKDRFRLFRIKPSTHDVQIEVQTFKIYRAPTYEAISYCWGDKADGTTNIMCNGRPLEIWVNLHAALRRLQTENSGSWYWCDALCIEQGEEEEAVIEKARQIAFMDTIFTLAQPVRAWLGKASKEEERAFQYLADTSERLAADGVPKDDTGMPDAKNEIWIYWTQILIRPWFARLWIVQECLVNDGKIIVTLGENTQTTWANFRQMVERTGSVAWADQPLSYDKIDSQAQHTVQHDFLAEWGLAWNEYLGHKSRPSRDDAFRNCLYRNIINLSELLFLERYHDAEYGFLQQVLKVCGNRKCAHDQDRPNAMRGILTDELKKGLKVYDTRTDVATVYREVTRLWLTNDPNLSLLQRIRPLGEFLPDGDKTGGTRLGNPSWVIDLGRVLIEALGAGIPNRLDGFHAGLVRRTSRSGKHEWNVPEASPLWSLARRRHVQFPTETQCHIAGVQVGHVRSLVIAQLKRASREASRTGQNMEPNSDFEQWVDDSLGLIQSVDSDLESSIEAHWRILVLDRTESKDPDVKQMFNVENRHSRRKAYENFMSNLKAGKSQLPQPPDEATARYYDIARMYASSFSNWFSTSTGHVGRSYAVPNAGDVVAVFYGASTPFLLRPVPGQDTYKFMGEAYVHGVMQGEALLEKNRAKYPKLIFKLE